MKVNYFVEDGVLMRRDWNFEEDVWDDHYPVNLVDVAHRLSALDNAEHERCCTCAELLDECEVCLKRYLTKVPIWNQPHMIVHIVEELLHRIEENKL